MKTLNAELAERAERSLEVFSAGVGGFCVEHDCSRTLQPREARVSGFTFVSFVSFVLIERHE